jgi:hypothetical protein
LSALKKLATYLNEGLSAKARGKSVARSSRGIARKLLAQQSAVGLAALRQCDCGQVFDQANSCSASYGILKGFANARPLSAKQFSTFFV